MREIDWNRMEEEFLAGGLSYAAFAGKYGLSLSAVKKRGAAGQWQKHLRERKAAEAAGPEPPEDLASEIRQNRKKRLQDAADILLEKIRCLLEEMEPDSANALATLVRALKDLQELQGLRKDALDLAEQQARIAKLRSQVREDTDADQGGVLLIPARDREPEPPEEGERSAE